LGYLKKYTIGLPGRLIKVIKGKPKSITDPSSLVPEIQSISNEENQLIKQLSNQLSLEANDKDGYITLAATMPEAISSAELTQRAQELLQQYIISFKVLKSSESLKFIQERYAEKEKEFKAAQQQLARFRDRNQFVNSALAQTTLERLQSEKELVQGVYNELAKQLETQQIQVKEDTPVFTVLKPVSVPIEKSKPNRPLILFIWTFIGGIIGVGMVFGKVFFGSVKKQWKGSEELETRD
jgi:predicted house-cleaning NTP pyrophosphatase (Maf/HAM1 superfamily)